MHKRKNKYSRRPCRVSAAATASMRVLAAAAILVMPGCGDGGDGKDVAALKSKMTELTTAHKELSRKLDSILKELANSKKAVVGREPRSKQNEDLFAERFNEEVLERLHGKLEQARTALRGEAAYEGLTMLKHIAKKYAYTEPGLEAQKIIRQLGLDEIELKPENARKIYEIASTKMRERDLLWRKLESARKKMRLGKIYEGVAALIEIRKKHPGTEQAINAENFLAHVGVETLDADTIRKDPVLQKVIKENIAARLLMEHYWHWWERMDFPRAKAVLQKIIEKHPESNIMLDAKQRLENFEQLKAEMKREREEEREEEGEEPLDEEELLERAGEGELDRRNPEGEDAVPLPVPDPGKAPEEKTPEPKQETF